VRCVDENGASLNERTVRLEVAGAKDGSPVACGLAEAD